MESLVVIPEGKHDLPSEASQTCIVVRKGSLHNSQMTESFGDLLKAARDAKGKTQQQVAVALGVTRQAVGQWESGANSPTAENLIRAFEFLGVAVPAALRQAVESAGLPKVGPVKVVSLNATNQQPIVERNPHTVRQSHDIQPLPRDLPIDVPVHGSAAAGPDADFWMNGEVVDYVRRPPGVSGAAKLYAIYVVGSSMAPKFEDGDLVYVSQGRPPKVGDYVVVELHPEKGERAGKGFIKRLVKRNPDKIVLEQFNPKRTITLQSVKVKQVHRVVPLNELFGV